MNSPIADEPEAPTHVAPRRGGMRLRDRFPSLRCCAAGLAAHLFNRVLMYIPCRNLRTLLFRIRVAAVVKGVCLLMGVEVRNGRNVSIGNRVVINRHVL